MSGGQGMAASTLPRELCFLIVSFCDALRDINAVAQTNRHWHDTLNSYLYHQDVRQHGSYALAWAAREGRDETARKALASGANIALSLDLRGGPLHLAAMYGREATLRFLLEQEGADPDERLIPGGRTPLSYAAEYGHAGTVVLLLATGAVDPDATSLPFLRTPLSYAAEQGHLEVVQLLLAHGNVEVNSQSFPKMRTPLAYAARYGHLKVVQLLLTQEHVKVDTQSLPDNYTPLFWAADGGHTEVIHELVAHGADQTVQIRRGRAPLSAAAEFGHFAAVEALLGHEGIEPDLIIRHGESPLWYASRSGDVRIVKRLLATGRVNPLRHSPWQQGMTPLCIAAVCGHLEILKLLHEAAAMEASQQDLRNGLNAALKGAARKDRWPCLKYLIATEEIDINVLCSDYRGQSRAPRSDADPKLKWFLYLGNHVQTKHFGTVAELLAIEGIRQSVMTVLQASRYLPPHMRSEAHVYLGEQMRKLEGWEWFQSPQIHTDATSESGLCMWSWSDRF